jgi:TonB-dependent starch-binding outer membrane protein SusC
MRSKFKWIYTLVLAFAMQFSFAQEKTITGTVTEGGMPLPGVGVIIKGTTTGTETDFNGKYSIKAKVGQELEFSYIGMKKQTIKVGASNSVNVAMMEDTDVLKEVVVEAGYGKTRTRATTTSATTTVSAAQIENRPNVSFLQSLQGQAPGLSVISGSGSPGSGKISLLIRGESSINGSTDPLIVIDGIPSNSNQFRNLNPNDIESSSIIRDAAGASIYGNRGANGVLIITTKQAKFGSKMKITYDTTTGIIDLPGNKYNMSNSQEALTLEKRFGFGFGTTLTDAQIAGFGINTNWADEIFGNDIAVQHNLGMSFGGENTSNFTSFGYSTQGGLVPTTDFKRFTLRNNFNGQSSNKKFTYNSQVTMGYSKRNELNQETNSAVNNNTIQNPLHASVMGLPYVIPNKYATGRDLFNAIGQNFAGENDTYVLQDILKGTLPSWFTETSAIANLAMGYKLTNNITINNKFGLEYKENDRVFARAPWSYLAIVVQNANGLQNGGFETQSNEKDITFTNIFSINFKKKFGENHSFDLTLFNEFQKAHYLFKSFTQNGLIDRSYVPGAGTGYAPYIPGAVSQNRPTVGGAKIDAATLSYFAAFDYDYKEKLGLSATIRRDGSYRFVEDYKWGTFWSIAGRWNIDKEKFAEKLPFNMLKLRASYGTLGNQNIVGANFGANALFTATNITRDLVSTGSGYNNNPGLLVSQIGNTTLRWEQTSQLNLGLDFITKGGKLEGNIDLYRKETTDQFGPLNLSAITSLYEISANNGTVRNSGVELSLKNNIINKNGYKLSIFANGAYNKNEVIEFDGGDQTGNDNVNISGGPIRQWNLVPYAGVNANNGNLLYTDRNGNLTETPILAGSNSDRRLDGRNSIPVYTGGFGLNADVKGFFLDVYFSYAADFWRFDNQLRWAYDVNNIGDDNISSDLLNAWTPNNSSSNFPSLTATNTTFDVDSDRWLYDSSFIRLKTASLGYNVPAKFLDKTFISSLKLFLMGENLLTWTNWRGFDPENFQALQVTAFPNPRTISFGASIQF